MILVSQVKGQVVDADLLINNTEEIAKLNLQEQLFVDSADYLKINFADKGTLLSSGFFTFSEVNEILNYRKQFGYFTSVEELQVINGLDIDRLTLLKDKLNFEIPLTFKNYLNFHNIKGQVLLRIGTPIVNTSNANEELFLGRQNKTAMGARLTINDHVSVNYSGEKDAGEKFQFNEQVRGFDFNSFRLTIKDLRKVKKLVVGDYQIQLGQGLVVWQGMSLGITSDIVTIRKQAMGIKDYNSMSESGFFRGYALEYKLRNSTLVNWISYLGEDATLYYDSINGSFIHSIKNDGYHRNQTELSSKNTIHPIVSGISYSFYWKQLKLDYNAIGIMNEIGIHPDIKYYNHFAATGNTFFNHSLSYAATKNNVNYFGELAFNLNNSPAVLNGIIASIDRNISISILQRYYDKKYQAIYANGFSQNTSTNNEQGLCLSLNYVINKKINFTTYYDLYKFPWLKYGVDMPSSGNDYSLQFNFTPNKKTAVSWRFQLKNKEESFNNENEKTKLISISRTKNFRFQFRTEVNRVQFTGRFDAIYLSNHDKGFLSYFDVAYKPFKKPYSFSLRWCMYHSVSYDSRLYAFQNDLPGSYSLGAYYGQGELLYLMIHYKLSRNLQMWLRGSRQIAVSQVADNKYSAPEIEFNAQLLYSF